MRVYSGLPECHVTKSEGPEMLCIYAVISLIRKLSKVHNLKSSRMHAGRVLITSNAREQMIFPIVIHDQ